MKQTVKTMWEHYRHLTYDRIRANKHEQERHRKTFYAGAACLLQLARSEEYDGNLQKLVDELKLDLEEIKAREKLWL